MSLIELDKKISRRNKRKGMMPSDVLIRYTARHCRISQGVIRDEIGHSGPSSGGEGVTFDRCLEVLRRMGLVVF
jgi:hypothetical protein